MVDQLFRFQELQDRSQCPKQTDTPTAIIAAVIFCAGRLWACNILGNKRRKAAAPCGDRGGFPFFNSIVYICILISNSSLHSSTTYLLLERLPHSYDLSQVHSLAYINSSFDIDSITRLTISCVASLTFLPLGFLSLFLLLQRSTVSSCRHFYWAFAAWECR